MLLVDLPPGYEEERRYVLDVILVDMLGLTYVARPAGPGEVRLRLAEDPGGPHVVLPDGLFATRRDQWLASTSLPPEPLRWVDVRTAGVGVATEQKLPVIYEAGLPTAPAVTREQKAVRLGIDVLGTVFFMLTRYEEVACRDRDSHGRFPARSSLAYRAGFLDRPVVDGVVDLLWSALVSCWPRVRRAPRNYRVHLTHDVDHPFATVGVSTPRVVRQAAGDLVRRRDPRLAARRLASRAAATHGRFGLDPYNTFGFLMDVAERHGLRSAFYLMSSEAVGEFGPAYRLEDPAIRRLLTTIAARGQELGLHGGYASWTDAPRLHREFERLLQVTDDLGIHQERWGGRQHYLRWENPATWRSWDEVGLDYDASVGFAELPGFRSGTCREHRVFDLVARRPLRLRERPLHVMLDATLFRYLRLSPTDAAQVVITLARRCRAHAGDLFVLCHNDFVAQSSTRRWYSSIVEAIVG